MAITSNSKRKKILRPQNVYHKCRLSYIAANVHLGLYRLLIIKKIFISKEVFSLENTGLQTVLPGILIIQVQEMVLQGYENLTGRKKQSDFTVKTEFRQHCSRFRPQLLLILYMFLHIVDSFLTVFYILMYCYCALYYFSVQVVQKRIHTNKMVYY